MPTFDKRELCNVMGADFKNHAFPAADLEPGGSSPRTEADTRNRKVPRPIEFPAGPELGRVVAACLSTEIRERTPRPQLAGRLQN